MAIQNTMYPPIVPDALPAFIQGGSCNIHFQLSPATNNNQIKNIQVSIVNARTNKTILKDAPNGIYVVPWNDSYVRQSDTNKSFPYYITINSNIVNFQANELYKIQMRFGSVAAQSIYPSATWFNNNINSFSEWSSSCLIKPIYQPRITIAEFDLEDANDSSKTKEFDSFYAISNIIGELIFIDGSNNKISEQTEYLKSYKIKLEESKSGIVTTVHETDWLYPNSYTPNNFSYAVPYLYKTDGSKYRITISYITNNLYENSDYFMFQLSDFSIYSIDASLAVEEQPERGRMKIQIIADQNSDYFFTPESQQPATTLIIRRTSSESNFEFWEDVYKLQNCPTTVSNNNGQNTIVWYDNTIESGIWYIYGMAREDSQGRRGTMKKESESDAERMCLFEDIFLTTENKQLRIKFNPSLSQFKYNVTQSQQVTLGGKYPFVKRNGNNYFRSFPIGGLISSFIDTTNWQQSYVDEGEHSNQLSSKLYAPSEKDQNSIFTVSNNGFNKENELALFTSKEEIYGAAAAPLYASYNEAHNIDQYNDVIYEREFREKVYQFLYANNVKLFKSATEGNILVKIMDINFQPIESLGRRLYSFTANAVEIDQANAINYAKYHISNSATYTVTTTTPEQGAEIPDIPDTPDDPVTPDGPQVKKETLYKMGQFQFSSDDYLPNTNIISEIKNKYNIEIATTQQKEVNGETVTIENKQWYIPKSVKHLTLTITSPPQLITQTSDGKLAYIQHGSAIASGYIVTIKHTAANDETEEVEEQILIPQTQSHLDTPIGYYDLDCTNINLASLYFKEPASSYSLIATIDYVIQVEYGKNVPKEQDSTTPESSTRTSSEIKLGQIYGTSNVVTSIINQTIRDKYYQLNRSPYLNIEFQQAWGFRIEAPVGSVIYIASGTTVNNQILSKHILNNGYLELTDDEGGDNIIVSGIYFYGKSFYKREINYITTTTGQNGAIIQTINIPQLQDNECIEVDGTYDSINDITQPIDNGVYTLNTSFGLFSEPIPSGNQTTVYNRADDLYYTELLKINLRTMFLNTIIYYHGQWYPFDNTNNEIICPLDYIINYICNIKETKEVGM